MNVVELSLQMLILAFSEASTLDIKKFERSIRRAKKSTTLSRRRDSELTFFGDKPEKDQTIMLDTCVFIDQIQGKLPTKIGTRIAKTSVYYSSLVLSELSVPFGSLDPSHSETYENLKQIKNLILSIPEHRIFTPTTKTMMHGAVLAGSISRILCYTKKKNRKEQHQNWLIDAMIASHAIEKQLLLITRNIIDFDRLSQLDNKLKVAFYRVN